MTMRKKITTLGAVILASACMLLCSCNDDIERSRVLFGEWQGYWGMFYEYNYRGRIYRFDSYSTDVVFYPDHEYATYGEGYQVDWYDRGPYSRLSFRFAWEVRNGIIYLTYPGFHEYDAEIYDYYLDDFQFSGYFGNSGSGFRLRKIYDYDWTPYYSYDYRYWTYDSWNWDGYYDYYAKSLNGTEAVQKDDSDTNAEDGIIRIGNRLAEEK